MEKRHTPIKEMRPIIEDHFLTKAPGIKAKEQKIQVNSVNFRIYPLRGHVISH